MKCDPAGLEHGIRHHQNRDQRKQKNGVRGTAPVPGRRKDKPANDGNSHAEKDHRRCIIPHGVVDPTGFCGESIGKTEGEESECAAGQDQETGKNQNVENSREPVARMPPLHQPELKNPAEPRQGPVKAEVALRASQR